MPDAVGENDVIFRRIERLAGSEQFDGESRRQHRRRRLARTMQHKHRLAGQLGIKEKKPKEGGLDEDGGASH